MAKSSQKRRNRKGSRSRPASKLPKPASRAGSHAGRGFRYQDAIAANLAVIIWADLRVPAIVIPEGGDDIELRGSDSVFVQVKSRREHLGQYQSSKTVSDISDLWKRHDGSVPHPDRLELILERGVEGLANQNNPAIPTKIDGEIGKQLHGRPNAASMLAKTKLYIMTSPLDAAIQTISDKTGCRPIAAQICFADLLKRVGDLADANGLLQADQYQGLSVSDTESAIAEILSVLDVDAIEQAIQQGLCEAVDFLTPLDDPNFYLGVDVEPGHVVAGLVSERPETRGSISQALETQRAALIVGPSGSGKSALMWETAYMMRHTVRWFRVRRLAVQDIPALRQLIRTMRASEASPIGFVMDDVGRQGPESWTAFLKEITSLPGVLLLGSIREEDIFLVAERSRASEIRADADNELAERLWLELKESQNTEYPGWLEPWKISNGLLLEYVHILTRGKRLNEVLADQVQARIADPDRDLELDILRLGAWAGSSGTRLDTNKVTDVLGCSDAELSRALQRLIEEHLIRAPEAGMFGGLHQLRSEELLQLSHQIPPPTHAVTFGRTLSAVPATDVELLVEDAVAKQRLPTAEVLDAIAARLLANPDAGVLASALRGLGGGRISAVIDEWFATPEVEVLPRTQIGTAAMFGVADLDWGNLDIIPEIQAAATCLAEMKGGIADDPRSQLFDQLSEENLRAIAANISLTELNDIVSALIGIPLPAKLHAILVSFVPSLDETNFNILSALLGTVGALDRSLANTWVDAIGQAELFARLESERAWVATPTISSETDGTIVSCDYWHVVVSQQPSPHDDVVKLCETLLSICPSADIAASRAIYANGSVAGLPEYPTATKRIARENLPVESVPAWNRRWIDLIARRVAAPSYSNYLERAISILHELVPTLDRVFDIHLRGRNVPQQLSDTLNRLNGLTEALTPPSISSEEVAGDTAGESDKAVTRFHNLLFCGTVNLVKRFARLPEQAGAYIGWLNDLIADVDRVVSEEPWELIASEPPSMLTRFKELLISVRILAEGSHERSKRPAEIWYKVGRAARTGNALGRVSAIARSATDKRVADYKAEIRSAITAVGAPATVHFRDRASAVLPLVSFEILVLLNVDTVVEAAQAVDTWAEPLRASVDHLISMTTTPVANGFSINRFTQSGHQTLFPNPDAGAEWLETLDISPLRSDALDALDLTFNAAGELAALDRCALATSSRAPEEGLARVSVQEDLDAGMPVLSRHLDEAAPEIKDEVMALIETIRTGEIDFVAETQQLMAGGQSAIMSELTVIIVYLLEHQLELNSSAVEA
ncbi:hypothetical protein [Parasphingorhabdus sp.]|uniref:hypothetical protein n=1 Tax=Parasphingorhabdus sp. TaxID=2709688 RepID=UPI003BAFEFB7